MKLDADLRSSYSVHLLEITHSLYSSRGEGKVIDLINKNIKHPHSWRHYEHQKKNNKIGEIFTMYKIEKKCNTNSENIPFSETKPSNREMGKAYE